MERLEGTVVVSGLPPHLGLSLSLCFFAVADFDTPPPYDADPPSGACTDCVDVLSQGLSPKESRESTVGTKFSIEREPGCYYVQVRAILYRTDSGKFFAQTEEFFFGRRPVRIAVGEKRDITFPVSWPDIPLEDLPLYEVVHPRKRRAWWRFW
jgi:hypothetical protein